MADVKLLLPETIYAVCGSEISLYYRNVITVIRPENYAFEVRCSKGRNDADRWRWTPSAEEEGEYPLTLEVWSDDGMEAKDSTMIKVVSAESGKGTKHTLLYIGDSECCVPGHVEELQERFQRPGNPDVTMVGSHTPRYFYAVPGKPLVEGYGGWGWNTFFTKEAPSGKYGDGMHPSSPEDIGSAFLFPKDGKMKFDLSRYLETFCKENIPDTVIFELGINNVFDCMDDTMCRDWIDRDIVPYMNRMFQEFKTILPYAAYGVVLVPGGAWSQDAFGKRNGCHQTRRRWRLNADLLNRFYLEQAKILHYDCIPVYLNLDTITAYPQMEEPVYAGSSRSVFRVADSVHPSPEGFIQWADAEYFWMKNVWENLQESQRK